MIQENTRAFLALIEWAEGTGHDPKTGAAIDPYRTCFGYRHTIQSFADHPAVTREWSGETLPEALCKKAGLSRGCRSSAAGRYQLIRLTWLGIKSRLRLPDFSPDSQDRAALYLIENRGALEDVHAGRILDAMTKCRAEWASLPGAGYGQPERRSADLFAAFKRAGGTLA
jgi:lysozyme